MSNIAMLHEKDPKDAILKELKHLNNIRLFGTQLLVAVYIRPEKTKGGIILANQARDEDRWQSKIGLVLKKGPNAFVEDDAKWFAGDDVNVGDWIVFRPSDGWNITLDGVLCRMLEDVSVKAVVSHPDQVW